MHCKLQNSIKIMKKQGNTEKDFNFVFSLLNIYSYEGGLKLLWFFLFLFLFIFLSLVKSRIRNKQKD